MVTDGSCVVSHISRGWTCQKRIQASSPTAVSQSIKDSLHVVVSMHTTRRQHPMSVVVATGRSHQSSCPVVAHPAHISLCLRPYGLKAQPVTTTIVSCTLPYWPIPTVERQKDP